MAVVVVVVVVVVAPMYVCREDGGRPTMFAIIVDVEVVGCLVTAQPAA